jgi:glycosyltransferase involved in cell wall biosynthesis
MPSPVGVLMDATPLQSEHRLRGVGTYVRHLAAELVAIAPERVAFLASRSGRELLHPDLQARAVFGIRGHRPAQVYWMYNEYFLRWALSRTRPAVFHATDFNGLVRLPGVATVATLHDLIQIDAPIRPGLSNTASRWRWDVYYRRKLPQADRIIAVSERVKAEAVTRLGLPPDRIHVVPPGANPALSPVHRGRGAFATSSPYLLFMGGPDPNKNFGRVLEAVGVLSGRGLGVRLLVASAWPPAARSHWEARARAAGLAKAVRWLGHVPPDDLASLYANATALVFPSLDEGFGSPVVEAMASGIPVVTSRHSPMADSAGDAALLVDPHRVRELADAMATVWTRGDRWRQLAAAGTARAPLFTWARAARATLAVYDAALGQPR